MTDNKNTEVVLDFDRPNRTGLSEAVFCEGKLLPQLLSICDTLNSNDASMLFTRLSQDHYQAIESSFPNLIAYDPVSRTGFVKPTEKLNTCSVAIVTGGSSDVPVAREASRTLAFYGHQTLQIDDVGVAGLWRLTNRLPEIEKMKIVISIAGMDAALPTVLGGLIKSCIIAVPTSIGYGMAKEGETALRALLVSCAPGLTVVNIDNGYGAACAAIRMLNQLSGSD